MGTSKTVLKGSHRYEQVWHQCIWWCTGLSGGSSSSAPLPNPGQFIRCLPTFLGESRAIVSNLDCVSHCLQPYFLLSGFWMPCRFVWEEETPGFDPCPHQAIVLTQDLTRPGYCIVRAKSQWFHRFVVSAVSCCRCVLGQDESKFGAFMQQPAMPEKHSAAGGTHTTNSVAEYGTGWHWLVRKS